MIKNLTEEEMMAVNCSFETARKAMIRAAKENRSNIEKAGKSLFILKRICTDNMMHRLISTTIAVSDQKEKLIDFFHEHYFADVEFNERDKTPDFETGMGEGCFDSREVALV